MTTKTKAMGSICMARNAEREIRGSTLAEIAEKVCKNVPRDHLILLCMERVAAWVELEKLGRRIKLPDSTDKTLVEQLNDALCMANGFIESNTTGQPPPRLGGGSAGPVCCVPNGSEKP